jgi:heat shock protein HslJ
MPNTAPPNPWRSARAWRLVALGALGALGATTAVADGCARSPRAVPRAGGTAATPAARQQAAEPAQRDSLTDRRWSLAELDGRPASAGLGGEVPYIRLRSDTARVEGSSGCNSLFGQYERGGSGGLRFDRLGSTRRACTDSIPADQERRFMAALAATRRYTIRGDTLTLFDEAALRARLAASDR